MLNALKRAPFLIEVREVVDDHRPRMQREPASTRRVWAAETGPRRHFRRRNQSPGRIERPWNTEHIRLLSRNGYRKHRRSNDIGAPVCSENVSVLAVPDVRLCAAARSYIFLLLEDIRGSRADSNSGATVARDLIVSGDRPFAHRIERSDTARKDRWSSKSLDFEHLDCVACDYVALCAIANAIHTLGGVPTDAQREKLAAYHDRQRGTWIKPPTYEEAVEGLAALGIDVASLDLDRPPPPPPRLGRNDPCHCGSGKKYKKCHLDEDARGGHAALTIRQ
jgi:hypothetical protein